MPVATTSPDVRQVSPVAKKKQESPNAAASDGRPISFRASQKLADRLDFIAEWLELDVSNLVRLVLSKHLHEYEEQAKAIQHEHGRSSDS
jgi:hypothetical protein